MTALSELLRLRPENKRAIAIKGLCRRYKGVSEEGKQNPSDRAHEARKNLDEAFIKAIVAEAKQMSYEAVKEAEGKITDNLRDLYKTLNPTAEEWKKKHGIEKSESVDSHTFYPYIVGTASAVVTGMMFEYEAKYGKH